MSSLNQAFIKAYQRREAAAPHITLPPAAPAKSDAADAKPAPPRPPLGEVRAFDRQAAAVPPAHHLGKSPSSVPLVSRYAADDVGHTSRPSEANDDPPRRAAEAPAPTGPASPAAPKIHLELEPAFIEPAFEVERFEWPEVITSLAGQAAADLAALIHELLPDGHGTLLVTGCRRGEGRTSIALLIARHLARSGSRVLAIDADLQRPNMAICLATEAELGWNEILAGGSPEQAMIESLADHLALLPLRKTADGAAQAAALHAMRGELLRKFDVLCIDAGPLVESQSGDEIDFGRTPVTAAIVVRDVRHSRLEQSHAVGRKLVKAGVSRWAILENFV